MTVISPNERAWPDLRPLWTHRELLYFLTWRDIQVRYKQTLLGASWAIFQPLITMLVFTAVFGGIAKVPSDGIPYPLFAFAGLLPWTYFAGAVTSASASLVSNSTLITKVYFPRMIIPIAAVLARLADLLVSLVLLFIMMIVYKVPASLAWIFLPLNLIAITLLAIGVGAYLAALNVKYRDIGVLLPFAMQMCMYATPIIYPLSLVPQRWLDLVKLNPLTGIIESFRNLLLGRPVALVDATWSLSITLAVVLLGLIAFARTERELADLV